MEKVCSDDMTDAGRSSLEKVGVLLGCGEVPAIRLGTTGSSRARRDKGCEKSVKMDGWKKGKLGMTRKEGSNKLEVGEASTGD